MSLFYILVFSIISHKEKRFMLPIVFAILLMVGYTLNRKVKSWPVSLILYSSVVVEIGIHGFYYIHHNLFKMTDYILEQNPHPHSIYTEKRYDQPWYSAFHQQYPN